MGWLAGIEVDPFTCPKCQGPMAVFAFIEAEDVIKKILKHLGLWDIKPRPPPGITKSSPSFTEPHIDYSNTQVLSSDNGLYHLAFIPTESEFISQSNHMLTPTINY
ncbi:MAG: transposase family protein [Deltaproteobacteria bacterium]|nr:transposase family protein [Deltaproteobacteria bacterium]